MLRATVAGSAFVGVFARALGDVILVRSDLAEPQLDQFAEALEGETIPVTVGGGSTVGALVAGNAAGVVTSDQLTDQEMDRLQGALDRPVVTLPGPMNAAGNLILTNDNGAYVHPEFSDAAVEVIADTLAVPVERGAIGGVRTVGMAAVANHTGVLCHPNATEAELDRLEQLLDVRADVGTINYGSPQVGSGLVVNDAGYVAGERTTGPELGRIEDALGFID